MQNKKVVQAVVWIVVIGMILGLVATVVGLF